jgi:hypothetical protein
MTTQQHNDDDTNPRSVHIDEARMQAHAKLKSEGWAWLPERSEFIHPEHGRGRLAYLPDFGADPNASMVREVCLQPPCPRPTTAADIMNHTPTVPPMVTVLDFWAVDLRGISDMLIAAGIKHTVGNASVTVPLASGDERLAIITEGVPMDHRFLVLWAANDDDAVGSELCSTDDLAEMMATVCEVVEHSHHTPGNCRCGEVEA